MNSFKKIWTKNKSSIITGLIYFLLIPFLASILIVEVLEGLRFMLENIGFDPDPDNSFHFFGAIFSSFWVFVWISCELAAGGWWLYLKVDNNPKRKAKRGRNVDHVAKLRSDANFKKIGYNGKLGDSHTNPGIVVASKGSKYPGREKTDMIVGVDEKNHVIGIGPTGTGKSQVWILPSIIHNLSTKDYVEKKVNKITGEEEEKNVKKAPFIIVTDVKGELYDQTHKYAREMGYKVHCFDTNTGAAAGPSLSYNPLYVLHKYHLAANEYEKQGNKIKAGEQRRILKEMIGDVVSVILRAEKDSKSDAFWRENEVQLLSGLFFLMFDLYDGGYLSDTSEVSFATAFELIQNKSELVELSKKYGKSRGFELYMKETAKTLENDPNDKTQLGILKGLSSKIQIFEIYRDKTSRDELSLIDQNEKNILYLKVPDHVEGSYKIVSLLIQTIYTTTVDAANERADKRAIRDIKVIWDEFANFPKVPTVTNMIRMSRSRGFQFVFMIQDQASLQAQYGKEESVVIVENCKTKMTLRVGPEDAKYFSAILGDRKKTANISYSHEAGKRPNYSVSEDYKEVLRPAEIQDLRIINDSFHFSEVIVVTPETKVLSKNVPWFKVKEHLTSGCRDYKYNIVESYFGPGTKMWRDVEKSLKKKRKNVKELNMKEEKANFIEDLWLKNPKKPKDTDTEMWMDQKWRQHKKKLLEENGGIIHSKDIKKEIEKRLQKQGFVTLGGRSESDIFKNMNDFELIGYSSNIKDIADHIMNSYKRSMPDIMKKHKLEPLYNDNIVSPFKTYKGTKNFFISSLPALKRIVELGTKDGVLVNHGRDKDIYKKWKQIETKFEVLIEDNDSKETSKEKESN